MELLPECQRTRRTVKTCAEACYANVNLHASKPNQSKPILFFFSAGGKSSKDSKGEEKGGKEGKGETWGPVRLPKEAF